MASFGNTSKLYFYLKIIIDGSFFSPICFAVDSYNYELRQNLIRKLCLDSSLTVDFPRGHKLAHNKR